jgi:pimeloyl-ACP methyl ester carboxylesterase
MGGFDQGLTIAENLESKYQVIAVSRFGYLGSPMPKNANFDQQADAYACLLDALKIPQVVIFGTSGGANSSIRFTARYPERTSALILLEPAAPGKVMPATPPRIIFDTILKSDFLYWVMTKVSFLRSIIQTAVGVPSGFPLTPTMQADIDKVIATTLPIQERNAGIIFDLFNSSSEFYQEISETAPYPLSKVKIPVLLISTLDDPNSIAENVKDLSEIFPNAHLLVLPEGGHMTLGHKDEMRAEVAHFLNTTLAEKENTK